MKVGYLITARLKSTRLPEKLLREVEGHPIFTHMLDRLKLANRIDEIIICTSTNPQDDRLEELAQAQGVSCFRGDEDDVLKRLYNASVSFDLDYILNITADCPFVDPIYVDKIVEAFETTNADLIRTFSLPHGAFSYGINPVALSQILEIKADNNTEVWGRYFTDTDLFKIYDLPINNPLHCQPGLRMTLDYPEDLEFFKAVFAALYKPGQVFSLDEILLFLRDHPEVVAINSHCAAAFQQRWKRQSQIALKPRHEIHRGAILGCGSIGQRHIRNLRLLGITDLIALRSHQGHYTDLDSALGVRETTDWNELIDARPEIAIISNPTSLHLEVASRLIPHVRGLFIEKPISDTLEGVAAFLDNLKDRRIVSFVGNNLQFHPVVLEIEKILESERLGAPLSMQCQVGHWLPEWHPYEDYRQAYYARKDLGGGTLLTLIHEVHLALQLLGPSQAVTCFINPSALLPLDVEVMADLMLQHNSGAVSQIHLDFLQRPAHRQGVISCENGWISYDLIRPQVAVQANGEDQPEITLQPENFQVNDHYVEEMRTFLQYVREGRCRHAYDAWNGAQSLAVVTSALASADSSKTVIVPGVKR